MRHARTAHLGLVRQHRHTTIEHLNVVAAAAREHDSRVVPIVLKDRHYPLRRHWWARRPSMFFAAHPLRKFEPVRGRVFSGVGLTKSEEIGRLAAAGFRVPRSALLTEHEMPDLSQFGPYVVVKPDVGARGATVKILRKGRVRWKPPEFVDAVYEGSPDLLVQEFIYTGRWPVSHQIQVLFGEALCCIRLEASHDRTPLADRYAFQGSGGGQVVVASSKGCSLSLCDDEELLDVAERVSALFPECANLGVDLVREIPSGDIYLLEVNCRGGCWLLSSPRADASCGAPVAEQRDGLRRAGRLLADAAVRLAE